MQVKGNKEEEKGGWSHQRINHRSTRLAKAKKYLRCRRNASGKGKAPAGSAGKWSPKRTFPDGPDCIFTLKKASCPTQRVVWFFSTPVLFSGDCADRDCVRCHVERSSLCRLDVAPFAELVPFSGEMKKTTAMGKTKLQNLLAGLWFPFGCGEERPLSARAGTPCSTPAMQCPYEPWSKYMVHAMDTPDHVQAFVMSGRGAGDAAC